MPIPRLHVVRGASGSLRGEDRDALGERAARWVLRDGQAEPRRCGGTGSGDECESGVEAEQR